MEFQQHFITMALVQLNKLNQCRTISRDRKFTGDCEIFRLYNL